MQLIIKVLKGQDCTVEVTPATTILEIKKQIEANLHIPIESQKLLLMGRTLNDDYNVCFYKNIKEGTKLNLVVMRKESLRDTIQRSFRKYYNEQQTESLTKEFILDFETKLKQMSLDDMERLAENINGKC